MIRQAGARLGQNERYAKRETALMFPIVSVLIAVSAMLTPTYALPLLRGFLQGEGWSRDLGDVTVLAVMFVVCTARSARAFRWE
jgi:hypothetical protein